MNLLFKKHGLVIKVSQACPKSSISAFVHLATDSGEAGHYRTMLNAKTYDELRARIVEHVRVPRGRRFLLFSTSEPSKNLFFQAYSVTKPAEAERYELEVYHLKMGNKTLLQTLHAVSTESLKHKVNHYRVDS